MTATMARHRRGEMAYHAGLAAEGLVARHYERRGFQIVHRRWRGKGGEIDLILRKTPGLVFVEVKKSRDFAAAAESLSAAQMRRLCASAEEFMANSLDGTLTDMRFDVALMDSTGTIQIIENAFGQG